MENTKNRPIKQKVLKGIAGALLEWIRDNCPYIPKGVKIRYQELGQDLEEDSLSLHTLKGSKKSKMYVDGSYEGYYPFAIYLRTTPDSTSTRLASVEVLEEVASWIDDQDEFPILGGNSEITEISQLTNCVLAHRHENGAEDYIVTFDLYFDGE